MGVGGGGGGSARVGEGVAVGGWGEGSVSGEVGQAVFTKQGGEDAAVKHHTLIPGRGVGGCDSISKIGEGVGLAGGGGNMGGVGGGKQQG